MGYTRFWARTQKPITQKCVDEINLLMDKCVMHGITICGPDGYDEPIISADCIAFNGCGEKDLEYEAFVINNEYNKVDFCKTATKPYDYAVREALNILSKYDIVNGVRADRPYDEIVSDAEYIRDHN